MPWIEKEGRTVDEARAAAVAELGLPEAEAEIEVIREGARGLFGLGGESALVRIRPLSEAVDVRSAFHSPSAGVVATEAVRTEAPVYAPPASQASAPVATAPAVVAEPEDEDADADDGPARPAVPLAERQQLTTDVAVEMVTGILDRMGLKGEINSRIAAGTVYVEVFGDDMGILIGRGGKTLEALQELVRAGVQRRLKARAAVVVDVEAYWERRRETNRSSGGRRRDRDRDESRGNR